MCAMIRSQLESHMRLMGTRDDVCTQCFHEGGIFLPLDDEEMNGGISFLRYCPRCDNYDEVDFFGNLVRQKTKTTQT